MKKMLLVISCSVASTLSVAQCNDLFISQYMEGSSNNKVIEIYNPTSINVPLAGLYSIRMYFNGSTSPTSIALTGTINANSTYVVCHASANASIQAVANQTFGGTMFNGNDAVELVRLLPSVTPVDIIGIIGPPAPTTEWTLNGASGTADHTLIRMTSVQQGTTTWTGVGELQWIILGSDDTTNLGYHYMTPCGFTSPTATVSINDTCTGLPSSFAANVSGGTPGYTYFWDFGDGSPVDNNASGLHTFPAAGTYNVQLVVVDQNVMSDTVTTTVTIHPNPVAAFTISGNTANGCEPDTFSFTNNSTGAATYNWDFGDATTSTMTNPPDKIYNAGTYYITLLATSVNGCAHDTTDTITVFAQPNVILQVNDTTICNYSFGIFLNAVGNTGTWSGTYVTDYANGTGFFSSAAITPGIYYAVYTISNACASDKDSIAITVEGPPAAGFTYVVNTGGLVNFTNTTTNGASYEWDFDGQGSSTQTNPSFTFTGTGTFAVCLNAYSTAGTCVSTNCQNITITGIEEINPSSFSIFPNPSQDGSFTVNWKHAQEGILYITDITGKNIFSEVIHADMTKIIQTGIAENGSYIIHWKTANGSSNTRFLIVR